MKELTVSNNLPTKYAPYPVVNVGSSIQHEDDAMLEAMNKTVLFLENQLPDLKEPPIFCLFSFKCNPKTKRSLLEHFNGKATKYKFQIADKLKSQVIIKKFTANTCKVLCRYCDRLIVGCSLLRLRDRDASLFRIDSLVVSQGDDFSDLLDLAGSGLSGPRIQIIEKSVNETGFSFICPTGINNEAMSSGGEIDDQLVTDCSQSERDDFVTAQQLHVRKKLITTLKERLEEKDNQLEEKDNQLQEMTARYMELLKSLEQNKK